MSRSRTWWWLTWGSKISSFLLWGWDGDDDSFGFSNLREDTLLVTARISETASNRFLLLQWVSYSFAGLASRPSNGPSVPRIIWVLCFRPRIQLACRTCQRPCTTLPLTRQSAATGWSRLGSNATVARRPLTNATKPAATTWRVSWWRQQSAPLEDAAMCQLVR